MCVCVYLLYLYICRVDCEPTDMKSGGKILDTEALKGLSDPELSPITAALPVEAAHLDKTSYCRSIII